MDASPDSVTVASKYLPVAAAAVDLAAEIARERLPSIIDAKGDRDMVSDADLAIERLDDDFVARHRAYQVEKMASTQLQYLAHSQVMIRCRAAPIPGRG